MASRKSPQAHAEILKSADYAHDPRPDRSNPRVISEIDTWRAANLLIRQHGAGAAPEATRRAGRMLDRGDSDGWQVWAKIRLAVEALHATSEGEPD
jgi:hypothetical protein